MSHQFQCLPRWREEAYISQEYQNNFFSKEANEEVRQGRAVQKEHDSQLLQLQIVKVKCTSP